MAADVDRAGTAASLGASIQELAAAVAGFRDPARHHVRDVGAWYLLVRTLHMRFHLSDAFRLGFLGYSFNFVSVGSVGGDLFKAFFIAREQPGRRTEAVATVVVDRLVGFYALLLVASLAILFGSVRHSVPAVKAICNMTLLVTAIGGVGLVLMLLPGFTSGNMAEFLCGLPRIGGTCERLIESFRMYRGSPLVMLGILAMSMGVHAGIAFCIYLIATALSRDFDAGRTSGHRAAQRRGRRTAFHARGLGVVRVRDGQAVSLRPRRRPDGSRRHSGRPDLSADDHCDRGCRRPLLLDQPCGSTPIDRRAQHSQEAVEDR